MKTMTQLQSDLGTAYLKGLKRNYSAAIKWFTLAAKAGDADAQFDLGLMHDNGHGVPKSAAEAVKWYRKAVKQGNKHAFHNLGLSHYYGTGVAKNLTLALEYLFISKELFGEASNGFINSLHFEKHLTRKQINAAREKALKKAAKFQAV